MWQITTADPWMLIDPATPTREILDYYKDNLRRLTKMMLRGDTEKILRPGKFDTEPPNNLELILRYADENLGGLVNTTKSK